MVFGAYHSVVFDHTTGRLTLFGGQCCVNGPYEYYNDVTWSLFWWHDFAPRITLGNELSQGAVFFFKSKSACIEKCSELHGIFAYLQLETMWECFGLECIG